MLTYDNLEGMNEEDIKEGLVSHWEASQEEVDRFDILVAQEEYEQYEGYAFYLLREKETGKLFEVNGGHCSCYGFEGQFEPEETSVEAMKMRKYGFAERLGENFLDSL